VRDLCGAVGLELRSADREPPDEEVLELLARRTEAKRVRDFATADRVRDEITARGWLVEDTAKGPVLRRR
jgi:cysteinyl-tRNA synthetase